MAYKLFLYKSGPLAISSQLWLTSCFCTRAAHWLFLHNGISLKAVSVQEWSAGCFFTKLQPGCFCTKLLIFFNYVVKRFESLKALYKFPIRLIIILCKSDPLVVSVQGRSTDCFSTIIIIIRAPNPHRP